MRSNPVVLERVREKVDESNTSILPKGSKLLFNAFRSVSLAVVVLLNVPFALVGQAALNGVLVLSAVEERRKGGYPIDEAIVMGAGERLRAVLMTAALAALGLIPAAMSKAIGSEMQRPMAVVIVGGTVSAALLTLIVMPVMYRALLPVFRKMGGLAEVPNLKSIAPPP